jgi:ribosomal-protein-alanine N-acetyltransferase
MTPWLTPPLRTSRILIRSPRPGDEPALVALLTDADVRRYVGGALDHDAAQERAAARVAQPGWGTFVIVLRSSNAVIGSGDVARKRGPWEVSYQLRRDCWGLGLAAEALTALTTWFFTTMQEPTLAAITQDANVRSYRLLERCGAVLTGTFEEYGALQRQYEFHHRQCLPGSVRVMPPRQR